jgi:tetratricopeptide (TPR) repeat protein/transcriptional regulator with XRE-family HTH domain
MAADASASTQAFGITLKRARRAARLTQAELAERAGFSVVYISMLERGARQPQRTTLALLSDALDLSPAERAAWEGAVRLSATAAPDRRRARDRTSSLPIGAFLGALPSGPLVGREAEQETIGRALHAVAQGQGRLLVLVGEPGVGKTRLAQEITLRARAHGYRVITGRCYEPQQVLAYSPFLEALTQAVALTTETTAVAVRWPEVARLLPEQLADHTTDTRPPSPGADGAERQRLYYQLAGFLSALAEQQPLALLLDDLHWADGASLELLQHLARHTRDQPLLLVATTRAVEAARQHPLVDALRDLGRDELVEQLFLPPLAADATAALIGVTLGGADGALGDASSISTELATRIQARSEGNAFFTRQLARALQEQGDLTFAEGQWRLRGTAPATFTPESIRTLIGQRLGRLTAHTQEVLREASVLGQVVAFEELRRMGSRGEQEVEEALEEAAGAGIMREGARDQYHFNHALTRDTLYTELSARKQRRLHRAAADAIEAMPGHARRAAELAYHLLAAEEAERALPYALLAGDEAEAVYAHAEAEGHYRAALSLAQELGEAPREAEALEKLGAAIHFLGRHGEAADACQRALRGYEKLDDQLGELRALAALLTAQASAGREKVDDAVALARVVLARIEPPDISAIAPDLGSALATAHNGLGWILWTSGRYADAQVELRQAIDLARDANDEAQLAQTQFRLLISGGLEHTVEAFEETLALAERSRQLMIVVASHNMAGAMYMRSGGFARALAHMEQSIVAAEQWQDLRHLAWQLKNFSRFLFDYGDWERMRAVFARADDLTQELDRSYGETWQSPDFPIHRGIYALAEGREEEGRRLLEEVIERIAEAVPASELLDPTCRLVEADLLAGDVEQARARITSFLHDPRPASPAWYGNEPLLLLLAWAEGLLGEESLAEARLATLLADASPLVRLDVLRIQGLLAILRQRWDVAAAALDEALERTRAMPFPYAELKALWVYGQLEAARGDPAAARKRLKQALLICDRLGEGLYRTQIARDLAALMHA